MTDQQDAPLCPHGHGEMDRGYVTALHLTGSGYVCRQCSAAATDDVLADAYERGRQDERQRLASRLWAPPVGQEDEYPNDLVERMAWITARALRAEAAEARMRELEEERDRLWEALQKIYFKAGSHTITPQAAARGEDDPGFAGIHAVALGALAGTCFRCGNPLPDCQCYGSKAMAEDHRQPQNEAPHGRCWCGRDVFSDDSTCQKGHESCPGCGQWVKWAKRAGWYDHRPGADAMPCPGPALHGYCPRHPGTPRRNRPPEHDGATGYLWCPKCEEEPNDANR